MVITFEDSDTAVVKIPASVISEETGNPIEDGFRVYEITLSHSDDPYDTPHMIHCFNRLEFAMNPDRPYQLSLVALGLDERYRIDDECPKFSSIMESVEDEWWLKFAGDYYEWVYGDPSEWRLKR